MQSQKDSCSHSQDLEFYSSVLTQSSLWLMKLANFVVVLYL